MYKMIVNYFTPKCQLLSLYKFVVGFLDVQVLSVDVFHLGQKIVARFLLERVSHLSFLFNSIEISCSETVGHSRFDHFLQARTRSFKLIVCTVFAVNGRLKTIDQVCFDLCQSTKLKFTHWYFCFYFFSSCVMVFCKLLKLLAFGTSLNFKTLFTSRIIFGTKLLFFVDNVFRNFDNNLLIFDNFFSSFYMSLNSWSPNLFSVQFNVLSVHFIALIISLLSLKSMNVYLFIEFLLYFHIRMPSMLSNVSQFCMFIRNRNLLLKSLIFVHQFFNSVLNHLFLFYR